MNKQHVGGAVAAQVADDGVDPLDILRQPALDFLQEVHPVTGASTRVGPCEGSAGCRTEGPEDGALATPALSRSPAWPGLPAAGPTRTGRLSQIALGVDGPHLVAAVQLRCPPVVRCRAARSVPFVRECGVDPFAEPSLWAAPTQALGEQDLVNPAAPQGDPFVLPPLSRQAVERSRGDRLAEGAWAGQRGPKKAGDLIRRVGRGTAAAGVIFQRRSAFLMEAPGSDRAPSLHPAQAPRRWWAASRLGWHARQCGHVRPAGPVPCASGPMSPRPSPRPRSDPGGKHAGARPVTRKHHDGA